MWRGIGAALRLADLPIVRQFNLARGIELASRAANAVECGYAGYMLLTPAKPSRSPSSCSPLCWRRPDPTILLPTQGNALGYRAPQRYGPEQLPLPGVLRRAGARRRLRQEVRCRTDVLPDWERGDWSQILYQDMANTEDVTIGMHSPSFDGHRLNTQQEMTNFNHHRLPDRDLWPQAERRLM